MTRACEKFSTYILGKPMNVITTSCSPPELKTHGCSSTPHFAVPIKYDYMAHHVPGKQLYAEVAPMSETQEEEEIRSQGGKMMSSTCSGCSGTKECFHTGLE